MHASVLKLIVGGGGKGEHVFCSPRFYLHVFASIKLNCFITLHNIW
jgi:hypothetical protein